MATEGRKIPPGAVFSRKRSRFFEIPRTSGTSLGTVATPKCPYGLHGMFTSQGEICEVNKSAWIANRAAKCSSRIFWKRGRIFLKFVGPVTSIWVLLLPETMHMVFKERLLAKKVFARSMKVFGWQLGTANFRDHEFPKKTPWLFGILRTSYNPMGNFAPCNHAYGLYGTFFSLGGICKINKSDWMVTGA